MPSPILGLMDTAGHDGHPMFAQDLVTDLNALFVSLHLPLRLTLESPDDLIPSLLVPAILECLLRSRLDTPSEVRQVRDFASKVQAMKIILDVLENDVIGHDVGLSPRRLAERMRLHAVYEVEAAVEWFGSLDVMVANAAVNTSSPVVDTSVEVSRWDRAFTVNLRVVLLCYKHAARQTIYQGRAGRIVVGLSSDWGSHNCGLMSLHTRALERGSKVMAINTAGNRSTSSRISTGLSGESPRTPRRNSQPEAWRNAQSSRSTNTYAPGVIDTNQWFERSSALPRLHDT
ncbi:hypothetical protein FOMPIDRAFT_1045442 [Fomitopsis schrenkii]|uniref:Uncharacterized protein n=1 Tax=Fomitopsis schrenkii TaxID=2126942 RepID=S8EJS2_FOMSC|nr:hypothetical protein FOMPIDRAFT_1045442 [Fomitopsis schrenkii]